jgi:hypothetical protein
MLKCVKTFIEKSLKKSLDESRGLLGNDSFPEN